MKKQISIVLSLIAAWVSTNESSTTAAVLYSNSLDNGSDVTILADTDTASAFVDYSNFTVGAQSFNIAEAPNSVGGAATRGMLLRANISAGAGAAINVLLGSTPQSFSGDYRLTYDVWMNSTLGQAPQTGTTEQTLWGIGVNNTGALEAATGRGNGAVGTYGWLTSENGSGSEDSAINANDVELADIGDTDSAAAAALFNAAFTNVFGTPNAAAVGQWVSVAIESNAGNVSVRYNGVEFFNEASAATTGFAMFGYEDRFSSVANPGDFSWGLYDNVVVTAVPEPSTAFALFGFAGLGLLRRRRA